MNRILIPILPLVFLAGCGSRPAGQETVPPTPATVTLVAVGDILMHTDVKQAAVHQGGFEHLWEDVTPLFQTADIVFGNLETPIAPIIGEPGKPYLFNAPADLPDALRRSGFQVLATANNHAYDQGARGLLETQSRLEVAGLLSIGSGRDEALAAAPRYLERQGIRFAFLAWTDLLNQALNVEGRGPWVNRLEESRAIEAVREARRQSDVVVVSLHWGNEDQHSPTARQREVAAKLLEAGADLIIGHHPHVLQPLERLEAGGRSVAVAYSLGNFISNQNRVYQSSAMPASAGDERDGAALVATFTRREGGPVELSDVGYTPLWTENNWHDMRSGKASLRDIRVVRLDAPDRAMEPWTQRRERIRGIMGPVPER